MIGAFHQSLIGTSHMRDGGVCQDASGTIALENGWVAAAVADGLGSASKSELGAAAAIRTVLSFVEENCPDFWYEESMIALLRLAFHRALNTISALAEENGDELCLYDTTLTAVIYNGVNAVYAHVGDGGIVALTPYGEFSVLTTAQKGEAFNVTVPLRAGPSQWTFGSTKESVCALTLMTDGIFDVVYPWILAKEEQPINVNYIRPFMDTNLLEVSTPADFKNVQAEIADYLQGPDNRLITDDKTIVGIINTAVKPEVKPDDFYKEPDWEALAETYKAQLYGTASSAESEKTSAVPLLSVEKEKDTEQKQSSWKHWRKRLIMLFHQKQGDAHDH